MKITNKEMTELEKISYDIACYVTHEHNKHDIRSLREFIENRIQESELNKNNDIHNVSDFFSFSSYLDNHCTYFDNTHEGNVYTHVTKQGLFTEQEVYDMWLNNR